MAEGKVDEWPDWFEDRDVLSIACDAKTGWIATSAINGNLAIFYNTREQRRVTIGTHYEADEAHISGGENGFLRIAVTGVNNDRPESGHAHRTTQAERQVGMPALQ
ncbi:MAG: hypothetical protein HY646_13840 [Acidobacteria bacterium]|nr:hypothetical protein [Acidobacteriota bacterium]